MRAHIWIRKEDEASWNEVLDKPTFIHESLKQHKTPQKLGVPVDLKTGNARSVEAIVKRRVSSNDPLGKLCEHGQAKGNCLFKGCPHTR